MQDVYGKAKPKVETAVEHSKGANITSMETIGEIMVQILSNFNENGSSHVR